MVRYLSITTAIVVLASSCPNVALGMESGPSPAGTRGGTESSQAPAADIYMEIKGVEGETDKGIASSAGSMMSTGAQGETVTSVGSSAAPAATDIYMEIKDVKGESDDDLAPLSGSAMSAAATTGKASKSSAASATDIYMEIEGVKGETVVAPKGQDTDQNGGLESAGTSSSPEEKKGNIGGAQSNPLYKDEGSLQTNPLYEGKAASEGKQEDVEGYFNPKEIVIDRSTWPDHEGETEKEVQARKEKATPVLLKTVRSQEDLEDYVQAVVDTDENVQKVEIVEDSVSLSYQHPAKILWLFPTTYTLTTKVEVRGWDPKKKEDIVGRVKVQIPWWAIFAKTDAKAIEQSMEEELAGMGDKAGMAPNDLERTQKVLEAMSTVSKARHDIAMNAIRNMK